MIRAKIEECRVTKAAALLAELKENKTNARVLCFLYTVEPDAYKDEVTAAAAKIQALHKDEDGLFVKEGKDQEELLSEVLPLYTLYETFLNKKEHYNELTAMCRAAVKKYPGSPKIFSMLSEVLEYFSEEIYEHYRTIQRLLWEQYEAVSVSMTEEVAYALAKACFYKAFLMEKYEDALQPFNSPEYPMAKYAIERLAHRFERN